jgi:hypothetical protein
VHGWAIDQVGCDAEAQASSEGCSHPGSVQIAAGGGDGPNQRITTNQHRRLRLAPSEPAHALEHQLEHLVTIPLSAQNLAFEDCAIG